MQAKNVMREVVESFGFGLLVAALGTAMIATSGCSGMEVGGRLGVYRVDERQESSRTYRSALPLKCYFTSCAPASTEEAQGS